MNLSTTNRRRKMANVARILAIDGGGIRGIIPALVLQRIEKRLKQPISELFHMIAGTSTGGILACALTAPAVGGAPRSAADIVDLYRVRGKEIFSSSFWHGFGSIGGVVDEKYPSDAIEKILEAYMADVRLSQIEQDLLITGYNIRSRKPYFFKSWKARGERLRKKESARDRDFLLRHAARATSAAPTYFEPAYVPNAAGKRFPIVDGGVFANNPVMCALSSARVLYPEATRFLIVSLGTGETQREIPYEEAKNWGLLQWARPLLYILFDGVSDAADYHMKQMFSRRDYFRFQVDLSADIDDRQAPNDDMDDATPENIEKLEAVAKTLLKNEKENLGRLLQQLRTPMTDRAGLVG
jgi:patatin-like phospholipase/acyl hydrolase